MHKTSLLAQSSGEYCKYSMGQKTAFTRPKVNRFGWNFEYCEPSFGGRLALTDFGCDPSSRDSLRGSRNFVCFLVRYITNDFIDFPSDKFYDICTQQRQSVLPCKLSEQNFENFTTRGRFSKETQKLLNNFQVLRLQAVINPQWLQMPKTHGMSSRHFHR